MGFLMAQAWPPAASFPTDACLSIPSSHLPPQGRAFCVASIWSSPLDLVAALLLW